MKLIIAVAFLFVLSSNCSNAQKEKIITTPLAIANAKLDTAAKTIHVLVALCDNKYHGIVPVPPAIGNGQLPNSNLYWGCAYGVRTFFRNSKKWEFLKQFRVNDTLPERLVFKSTTGSYYLVADAYDGKFIKKCTIDFFNYSAGNAKGTLALNGDTIGIGGNASLVAYAGHDGLMDFQLNEKFENSDGRKRDAIMLACISKSYFAKHLAATKANPILWSTGLMCPEAYTLHDAIDAYINKGNIRHAAAKAYSKYQHCSLKAAKHLLVTGW